MSTQKELPSWLNDAIIYNIYPQSFNDTNSDGIGDLKGITEKLEYIQSLGANCIWINPVFKSPFLDAGYDVSDYYQIAERYGDLEDFKQLISEAKKRGIRVLLDLVAGHTSWDHPWFKESCKGDDNPYSDYYIWTDARIQKKRFVNGIGERDGGYMYNFYVHQPALNYGYYNIDENSPWQISMDDPRALKVHQELRNVISFWMDFGIDGFRVDMAMSIIKNDPECIGIKKFWSRLRSWFNTEYPDGVLLSEWGNPARAIDVGFHVDFMHQFGTLGWWNLFRDQVDPGQDLDVGFFSRSGEGCIEDFLSVFLEHHAKTKEKGYICIPSANHDTNRPSIHRSGRDLRVIQAFLLTAPGVPLIYYGDEIGMRFYKGLKNKEGAYYRSSSRTPMQWDSTVNAGFSTADKNELYLPIDPQNDRPTVDSQDTDEDSLLNLVRKLTKIRQETPALENNGDIIPVYAKNKKIPFVYLRKNNDDQYAMVVLNPSMNNETITIETDKIDGKTILSEGVTLLQEDGHKWEIGVKPQSFGIFE